MARLKKPTISLDANVVSILHYRGSDTTCLAQQAVTQEWWDNERSYFKVFGSVFVEDELANGEYQWQLAALAEAKRLQYLQPSGFVRQCAAEYLRARIVPHSKPVDALHLAIASVHELDYLLTWNQAHLANSEVLARLKALNLQLGLRTPWIVTPYSIPKVSLGQQIRRRA